MSTSNLVENIVAAVPAITLCGGAITWIWNKVEKRFKRIEAELEHCRMREIDALERRGTHLTVIELLWNEIKRFAPDSDVLDRAHYLLDRLKKQGKSE
ncbi:hypothetical protein [Novosphingobium sp. FKTRR1]|uniref:hypothetical protein n=1 Tax=Novosphingobium sp. FKTRR1 TaxID=2879118 RepID=UPI001CEFD850|nr:hypothetical protein [Novosphingobium sp. FKTRR1]